MTAKQKKHNQLVDAIELRLIDILAGAYGPYVPTSIQEVVDGHTGVSYLGIDVLSRFVGGVRFAFDTPGERFEEYPWSLVGLDNWDKPLRDIAEWLSGMNFVVDSMKGRA